jgi:sensor histidine kinase YesM
VRVAGRRSGDTLELTVADDGPGPDPSLVRSAAAPPGHGIANTRERLRALYGERASLEVVAGPGGGTTATLRIPYRELVLEAPDGG